MGYEIIAKKVLKKLGYVLHKQKNVLYLHPLWGLCVIVY